MANTPITDQSKAGFEPVAEAFRKNFDDGLELGAGFAAYLDGELIVDLHGGWFDKKETVPWAADTIAPVYSTSKAIAALVVAHLLDRNDADYDTPVAEIWPEFGVHGKDKVSIGQALSHQAGVPGFKDPIDPALWLDPPALAAALAALEPMWPPGEGAGYHPLTWGYIAGEVARRLSGRSLGTVLREVFTNADGEDPATEVIDFRIGTPRREHHRVAEMKRPMELPDLSNLNQFRRVSFLTKWAAPDRSGPEWREAEMPSANGHGNARSVARLYSIYAQGGRLGDREMVSPETFAELTKPWASGPDRVLPYEMTFGAGVMLNTDGIYGPNRATLAHAGWGGCMAFGDPDRGLSAAYVMNRQTNALQGDVRAKRLIDALYGCF